MMPWAFEGEDGGRTPRRDWGRDGKVMAVFYFLSLFYFFGNGRFYLLPISLFFLAFFYRQPFIRLPVGWHFIFFCIRAKPLGWFPAKKSQSWMGRFSFGSRWQDGTDAVYDSPTPQRGRVPEEVRGRQRRAAPRSRRAHQVKEDPS
jgi:hypothetical protein